MTDSTAAPKDARDLLYDLVLACRAYDSTKPAHVQEYSFALDQAEAFLHTPRSEIKRTYEDGLEDAATVVEDMADLVGAAEAEYHGYDKHGHGDLGKQYAMNIRALKNAAPQVANAAEQDGKPHWPARASSEAGKERYKEALQEILRHHANDNHRPKAFYIAADALDERSATDCLSGGDK